MRTVSYKAENSPALLISTELLQNCFLHKEIREKGGAYGSEAVYAPTTGNFYFYSYRDPQLAKTVEAFQKSMEKIGRGLFTEEQLEEAKLGVIQTLDTPVPPSSRAMAAYSWQRAGRTLETREQFRNQILSATKNQITRAVEESLLPLRKTLVTFLDQTLFEKEKKKIKQQLVVLPFE